MPRTCTICKHKKVGQIEAALVQGTSLRDIARQFKVTKDSLSRHQEHIAEVIAKAKERFELERGATLAEQLNDLRSQTEQILSMFMDYLSPFNGELALKAIDRRHKQIEIEAKLTGEFKAPETNPEDVRRSLDGAVQEFIRLAEEKGYSVTEDEAKRFVEPRMISEAIQ